MRRSSLTFSGVFHLTVLLIAAFGLPYTRREFVIPPPIVVDFVDISKVTQTDKVSPVPVKPDKEEPKKDQPPPPPAAQNTSAAPAAPVKDKAPDEPKKDVKPS